MKQYVDPSSADSKTCPMGPSWVQCTTDNWHHADLASAKSACDSDSNCTGIGYWDGKFNPDGMPPMPTSAGYWIYHGDTTMGPLVEPRSNTPIKSPLGTLTFTPVVTCPVAPAAPASVPTSSSSSSSSSAPASVTPSSSSTSSMAASVAAVAAASAPNTQTSPTSTVGAASGVSFTFMGAYMGANIVFGLIVLGLGYYYFFHSTDALMSRGTMFVILTLVAAFVVYGGYFILQGALGNQMWSGNVTPSVGVTNNTAMSVPGSTIPSGSGTNSSNYGAQWWMFIQDWNYRFGQEKTVITRGGSGALNPYVFLDPVENTLDVKINVMSGGAGASGSSAPSPVGGDGSATDDSFTCKVKDVPLQTWFAVSMSVSGRNVDIYLNGMLVRSCLLPGVPQAPIGDVGVLTNGGYSGNLAALNFYARPLTPTDASAFYHAGPPAAAVAQTTQTSTKPTNPYVVKLAVVDPAGQEINKYTF